MMVRYRSTACLSVGAVNEQNTTQHLFSVQFSASFQVAGAVFCAVFSFKWLWTGGNTYI